MGQVWRNIARIAIACICLFAWNNAAQAAPAKQLIHNQWTMLSLPAEFPDGHSASAIFGELLSIETYGADGDWILYRYEPAKNRYLPVTLDEALLPGAGYWFIQTTGVDIELELPSDSTAFPAAPDTDCPYEQACIEVALESAQAGAWNLVGYPQAVEQPFADTQIRAVPGACSSGCTPDAAKSNGVIHLPLYRYNGADYDEIFSTDALQPWDAAWMLTLPAAEVMESSWLIPRAGEKANARIDAARLLTQASFGPTLADIDSIVMQGDAETWIEQQLKLPITYHLPLVHSIANDGWGYQPDRYQVFWEQALRAEDQLRQRVAFALSEILVVSDIPDALINHGNMLAAYYDILLHHAFGNYRDLLKAVTLSPAMGIYLSMLGNDKPDPESGRRADENYAREVMQLFSIGLVQLKLDGSVVLDSSGAMVPTYEQKDVQNLANVFTGWSWDIEHFETSAVAGWWPDRGVMERPMKAFAAHHDSAEKVVLGQTFPAGQTPEQDMDQAIDILFQHANVAPFISRQLIQRLVTSNPSPEYISRVARVFNGNEQGIRGDLGAVVKAILLDKEARSATTAKSEHFGKLREPVLRLSHLWRAFNMTSPVPMGFWKHELSQHAPLTANSVFNFFSPTHKPTGPLREADLFAPEFQLNSESNLNKINTALAFVIQDGSFFNVFPTPLDLDYERELMDSPAKLVDHLDLLLMSGNMSVGLADLLEEYIRVNLELVGAERVLRDVISLAFTSADYAIQQ